MSLPIVAIVGRPNVGKSALFNRLIRKRLAIVEETPGLTRDRLYAECEWEGRLFTLIDTGGLSAGATVSGGAGTLGAEVRAQTLQAIGEADVLILVVDARTGALPEDVEVADLLRRARKPVLVAANKVDHPQHEAAVHEFHALGLGNPIAVSAHHGHGTGDLLDEVVLLLPPAEVESAAERGLRVAVIGRPNVGKSSLINAVLGQNRVIVADAPGTTRDAVDVHFRLADREFVLIDTAGLRRRSRIDGAIERYSVSRARDAIDRADLVLLVVDASAAPADQDQRIAREATDAGRGLVIVLNKWDLVAPGERDQVLRVVRHALRFVAHAPVVPVSAKTKGGIQRLLTTTQTVADAYDRRVATGPLNRVIDAAEQATPPPADSRGRPAKIFYATQAQARPPVLVLFVNDPTLLNVSYLRYLERAVRAEFDFAGVPLRFVLRTRERSASFREGSRPRRDASRPRREASRSGRDASSPQREASRAGRDTSRSRRGAPGSRRERGGRPA